MSPTAQHPVLQAPLAHAVLAALAVAPLVLPVPTNANIVITAVLTVSCGVISCCLVYQGAVPPLAARPLRPLVAQSAPCWCCATPLPGVCGLLAVRQAGAAAGGDDQEGVR